MSYVKKPCPAGSPKAIDGNHVCNDKTGKWVKKTGKIGLNVQVAMPVHKRPHIDQPPLATSTGVKTKKPCPPTSPKATDGKHICNDKTGNWVVKTGKLGMHLQLLEEQKGADVGGSKSKMPVTAASASPKSKPSAKNGSPCPPSSPKATDGKHVCNDKTGKWVLKTGKVGAALLAGTAAAQQQQPSTSPKKSVTVPPKKVTKKSALHIHMNTDVVDDKTYEDFEVLTDDYGYAFTESGDKTFTVKGLDDKWPQFVNDAKLVLGKYFVSSEIVHYGTGVVGTTATAAGPPTQEGYYLFTFIDAMSAKTFTKKYKGTVVQHEVLGVDGSGDGKAVQLNKPYGGLDFNILETIKSEFKSVLVSIAYVYTGMAISSPKFLFMNPHPHPHPTSTKSSQYQTQQPLVGNQGYYIITFNDPEHVKIFWIIYKGSDDLWDNLSREPDGLSLKLPAPSGALNNKILSEITSYFKDKLVSIVYKAYDGDAFPTILFKAASKPKGDENTDTTARDGGTIECNGRVYSKSDLITELVSKFGGTYDTYAKVGITELCKMLGFKKGELKFKNTYHHHHLPETIPRQLENVYPAYKSKLKAQLDYVDSLNPETKLAILRYTHQWDWKINQVLMQDPDDPKSIVHPMEKDFGVKSPKFLEYGYEHVPYTKISHIQRRVDNAFVNVPALESDIVVYRGIRAELAPYVHNPAFEKQYWSTSLSKNISKQFKGKSCCMLTIKVPKGSHVLPVAGVSKYPIEQEVLLPRNGHYEITKNTDKGDVQMIFHENLRALQPSASAAAPTPLYDEYIKSVYVTLTVSEKSEGKSIIPLIESYMGHSSPTDTDTGGVWYWGPTKFGKYSHIPYATSALPYILQNKKLTSKYPYLTFTYVVKTNKNKRHTLDVKGGNVYAHGDTTPIKLQKAKPILVKQQEAPTPAPPPTGSISISLMTNDKQMVSTVAKVLGKPLTTTTTSVEWVVAYPAQTLYNVKTLPFIDKLAELSGEFDMIRFMYDVITPGVGQQTRKLTITNGRVYDGSKIVYAHKENPPPSTVVDEQPQHIASIKMAMVITNSHALENVLIHLVYELLGKPSYKSATGDVSEWNEQVFVAFTGKPLTTSNLPRFDMLKKISKYNEVVFQYIVRTDKSNIYSIQLEGGKIIDAPPGLVKPIAKAKKSTQKVGQVPLPQSATGSGPYKSVDVYTTLTANNLANAVLNILSSKFPSPSKVTQTINVHKNSEGTYNYMFTITDPPPNVGDILKSFKYKDTTFKIYKKHA